MASPQLLASTVMDLAAARMNDVTRSIYPYSVQIPYLNMALLELQEIYEANNVPVTDQTAAIIEVDAVTPTVILEIPFDDNVATGVPGFLPNDLIEFKVAWQSTRDLNQWTRFTPVDYLAQYQLNAQISCFNNYQWATNCMKVLSANADNDIKLDYIRSIFPTVTSEEDELFVINGVSFLFNRTASLLAHD